jgi:hypothetical protein
VPETLTCCCVMAPSSAWADQSIYRT